MGNTLFHSCRVQRELTIVLLPPFPNPPAGFPVKECVAKQLTTFHKDFFFLIPNFLEGNPVIKFFRIKIIFTL